MSSHYVTAEHPRFGPCSVEVVIEIWGYGSNGWDDPGQGTEYYIDAIYSCNDTIVWYFPKSDSLDEWTDLIDEEVQQINPDSDYDWMD